MASITDHAVQRYRERIDDVGPLKAREIMQAASDIIDTAAKFSCHTVVLGNGARLLLRGDTVVTVTDKCPWKRAH